MQQDARQPITLLVLAGALAALAAWTQVLPPSLFGLKSRLDILAERIADGQDMYSAPARVIAEHSTAAIRGVITMPTPQDLALACFLRADGSIIPVVMKVFDNGRIARASEVGQQDYEAGASAAEACRIGLLPDSHQEKETER